MLAELRLDKTKNILPDFYKQPEDELSTELLRGEVADEALGSFCGAVRLAPGRLRSGGGSRSAGYRAGMTPPIRPLYAGHRFPPEVVGHALWLYVRFPLGVAVDGAGRSDRELGPTAGPIARGRISLPGQALGKPLGRTLNPCGGIPRRLRRQALARARLPRLGRPP